MGKLFAITFDGRVYSCKHCELTSPSPMTSCPGRATDDYWDAYSHDKDQKYKEGKFILVRFKVLGPDGGIYLPVVEGHYSGSEED
ncbi:yippee-like-like protein [Drosera capensis]